MNIQSLNRLKITVFSVLCTLFFGLLNAQDQPQTEKSEFWKHIRFGGGIGFSIRGNDFSGTIAPSAIYEANETLSFGLGLNGSIYNRKNIFKSTILGGSVITLVNPIRAVQLSAEFEELHVTRKWDEFYDREDEKYWYPALFLGAGYRTGNFTFGVRYDVLYDRQKSIYSEAWMPFFRVYF
ncbi:MAG: alpha-ketoglutarate decarboxylase [Flavobacteriaceae bacterium]|nr:alpha-ketoglutarate decarboxylase [Flavobacteriaceae bacterium]